MRMCKGLFNLIGPILAAESGTLGAGAGEGARVIPLIGDFTEDPGKVYADIESNVPEGEWIANKLSVAGTQDESLEPGTGDILISLKPPAGGFRWETPSNHEGTVVVTGYAVAQIVDETWTLWAIHRFANSITLNAPNQAFTIPDVSFRIPRSAI